MSRHSIAYSLRALARSLRKSVHAGEQRERESPEPQINNSSTGCYGRCQTVSNYVQSPIELLKKSHATTPTSVLKSCEFSEMGSCRCSWSYTFLAEVYGNLTASHGILCRPRRGVVREPWMLAHPLLATAGHFRIWHFASELLQGR